ncbi:uncharacterized protein [Ptychodera flava]|uniref:uncharacterized protein n=1 Tax=Ptychodera flava TaxID=63121 RepID=UPI00396A908D
MSQEESQCSSYKSSQDSDFSPSAREIRSENQLENYLEGFARGAYMLKPQLSRHLQELDRNEKAPRYPCSKCSPILNSAKESFTSIIHPADQLLKRRACYPHPKKRQKHHRNISKENDWLLENVFDVLGNYQFCQPCVVQVLGVGSERLAKLREVKRNLQQEPTKIITKQEVVNQRLEKNVIMPRAVQETFHQWWSTVGENERVEVVAEKPQHGLVGKPSNHAKTGLQEQFLSFVDMNSQHNGRSNSSLVEYFFTPKFSRINTPKPDESNFDIKMKSSVVGEFNRTQNEQGKSTCSNSSAKRWLDGHRPKHGIMPHQTDYCDTCKELLQRISSTTAIMRRKTQSGNADEEEMTKLENNKKSVEEELQKHKEQAQQGYRYYKDTVNKCYTQGKRIRQLEDKDNLSADERAELDDLKDSFVAVLSLDFK